MASLPQRKDIRLKNWDYSTAGMYFITICTKDRKNILSTIRVGGGAPTRANLSVSRYVSALKRFTNKKYGADIWQRSYYDHIIRNEADYMEKAEYILNNPISWTADTYYI